MSPFTKCLIEKITEDRKKAIKEGRAEGRAEGMAKGRIKGRLEGKKENEKQIVKNMLKFGETEEKIMKYIGIDQKELDNIKNTI